MPKQGIIRADGRPYEGIEKGLRELNRGLPSEWKTKLPDGHPAR